MAFEIESPAFGPDEVIPARYTCTGEDVSVPLIWKGAPERTVSFAVICDDPDAPSGSWVHWVIYNIAPRLNALNEGVIQKEKSEDGSLQGLNDFHKIGYHGPCPPPGAPHRYVFTIYALDTGLYLKGDVTKQSLLQAMKGHILAQAFLIGRYGR